MVKKKSKKSTRKSVKSRKSRVKSSKINKTDDGIVQGNLLGSWAFLIGILIAIIIGLFASELSPSIQTAAEKTLIVLGITIGFLNIKNKEISSFLLASVALVIVVGIGHGLITILPFYFICRELIILFVPAAIIAALKVMFEAAKD